MFDIRPTDETGDLDWERIKKTGKNSIWGKKEGFNLKPPNEKIPLRNLLNQSEGADVYLLGEKFKSADVPIFTKNNPEPLEYLKPAQKIKDYQETFEEIKYDQKKPRKIKGKFSLYNLFLIFKSNFSFTFARSSLPFGLFLIIISLIIGGFVFGAKSLVIKGRVLGVSQDGYSRLNSAIENIKKQDFESSGIEFEKSYEKFSLASRDLDEMGSFFIELSRFFPFSSKLSSGKNLIEAGKHISLAGKSINEIIKTINSIKNPLDEENKNSISFLEIFQLTQKEVKSLNQELKLVNENLEKVNLRDLPEDKQQQFLSLKNKLPSIIEVTDDFLGNGEIFVDLLGGNGPRKYLFLFQNNQEMRPTGGFIGSYGLLDISEGRIRSFFVDGIFNPDGQLQEKIVPPKPIQKISAAWSLHDSNWFPDFPVSAKKAIVFYEKTGGPTTDGVITLTPTIIQKFLEITGPIEMKDYDVTIDSENFIEKTQYEVEVDYDKEENKPKKILSDLAPIILDKIFNSRDPKILAETIKTLSFGLTQKHILLYSQDENLQRIIAARGWSGEILDTSKDYLSVVNSNINGYKTDGVIEEEITHQAEIRSDGGIIDTVTIKRHHNGGNSEYEWWNKVNADYLRVYVPLGSKLLEASGQTRETVKSPLDYDLLEFKKDPLIEKEERESIIHEESGTRIYEDSGKTVFANWTYVSPQETMTLTYKYLLPFKINFNNGEKPADSYSLLTQKQSGSIGSQFVSSIKFPKNFSIIWKYPENITKESNSLKLETNLDIDRFWGIVFTKEGIIND